MKATVLRLVLVGGLLVFVGLVGFGAWWANEVLRQSVLEADHAKVDAEISHLEVEKLRKLQSELADKKDIVQRASQIASTAQNYQYQDQVVSDLQTYARKTGIDIASFDFAGGASGEGQSGPAGTTLTPFTINLRGPLAYDKVMQFLRDIENNLTKLQVVSLSLSPSKEDAKQLTNPSMSLVVYLKK